MDESLPRYIGIAIYLDTTESVRSVTLKLFPGTPAENPSLPTIPQDAEHVRLLMYIYEAILNNQAVSVPFGWLGSVGNYINVLHECSGINTGEYYLAWKAVTDNTSPMIRSVKVVDVTI